VTAEGQWCPVRHGFLLPVRVVMAVCRGTLLSASRRAGSQGPLELPEGMSSQRLANLLNKLGRQQWHVHIRERYPHGTGVLISLARYLRGGPLSNQRLVSHADGEVTFRYRVNGEASDRKPRGLMTLPIAECIRRYLLHVPHPGTKVVRCDGLYAPTKRAALAAGRAQLGQGPLEAPAVPDWQTAGKTRGDAHPERCPQCGRLLICSGVILPARIPPPAERPWEVVACIAGATVS
jgi:Putative transposase